MNNYTFGNYICELREKRGLSQKQLGEKLGVSNKAISKWENGGAYPSSELMLPLAKALGVSIEELYSAISKCKSEKSKLRAVLDTLSNKALYIIIGTALYSIALWVLFLIFGAGTEKDKLLIITPIMAVIIYGFIRFMFYILKRNPMTPSKFIDALFAAFYVASAFMVMVSLANFITDFPDGYSPIVGALLGMVSGLLLANKKRT